MSLHRFVFRAMAGDNEVLVHADSDATAARSSEAAIAEVKRIEAKYSRYHNDSLISKINAAAGRHAVAIDAETAKLLDYADVCFRQSDGVFDITCGILRRAWDFHSPRLPDPDVLEALLPLIDWPAVERDAQHVYLPKSGMQLDFGGFGKEYAADRGCEMLRAHGARHALINLGGDVCVTGPQIDDSGWRVGIRHPRRHNELIARVTLEHGALATSGDYERYKIVNGVRYSHILDPRTGWPVRDGFQSVSVMADACLLAGSATTVALLKGETLGQEWLCQLGFPYLTVSAEGIRACHPEGIISDS